MKSLQVGQFLVADPRICHGKLTFQGTRITVATVLQELAKGKTRQSILARWPKVTAEALAEAVRFAAEALVARTPAANRHENPLQEPVRIGKHLIVHPNVCFGKLTFDGTRVPVSTVLAYLAKGRNLEELREGWPDVSPEAIVEAIRLATAALGERYPAPVETGDEPIRSGRSA